MMIDSGVIFGMLFLAAVSAFGMGRGLGRAGNAIALIAIAASAGAVGLATIFKFRPALLPRLVSLDAAVWLEGLVAVFPWMLLVGLLHTNPKTSSLRRAAPLMFVLGIVYFAFGGIWMVLPTVRTDAPEHRSAAGVTIQARHDTCAPSAAATALRLMGLHATEERMCEVVLAKPTRGSSLVRAAWGLRQHLATHGMTAELLDLSAREVMDRASPDKPMLIVIRSNVAADHMVTLLGRDAAGNVVIANPSPGGHGGIEPLDSREEYGIEVFAPEDFRKLYRRGAIVFSNAPQTTRRALR